MLSLGTRSRTRLPPGLERPAGHLLQGLKVIPLRAVIAKAVVEVDHEVAGILEAVEVAQLSFFKGGALQVLPLGLGPGFGT